MRTIHGLILLALSAGMTGCVTESSGGLPGPAPVKERVQAHLELARGYLEQRDFVRAKPPLERALEIDPRSVETHVLTAVVMQAENEPELAEEHYLTALGIRPEDPQALNNYASFLYAQSRFADALVPLKKLVRNTTYRARPLAFESLGLAHLQLGESEAAGAAFTRALELNQRLPRSVLALAEIGFATGDLEVAERRFNEYNRLARPSAGSLCLGLKLAFANQDADSIASYGLSLKNLYPEQADQCQMKSP